MKWKKFHFELTEAAQTACFLTNLTEYEHD